MLKTWATILEKLPYVRINYEAEVTELRNGEVCIHIDVPGIDVQSHTDDHLGALIGIKEDLLASLPSWISLTFITTRWKVAATDLMAGDYEEGSLAGKIDARWTDGMGSGYETKTVIQITTVGSKKLDQVLDKAAGTTVSGADARAVDLRFAASEICGRLSEFGARIINGEESAQFITECLAGRALQPVTCEPGYHEILPEADVSWPRGKKYSLRQGPDAGTRYSAFLSVTGLGKTVATETTAGMYMLPISFIVTSALSIVSTEKEATRQERSIKEAGFLKSPALQIEQVSALVEEYSSAISVPFRQALNIEVLGESLDALEKAVDLITSTLHSEGVRLKRETVQQETCFWGRLPGGAHTLPRQRVRASSVIARLTPFIGPASGLKKCTWGDSPLAAFKTPAGSIYGYTHHATEESKALGNIAIFGQSGQGKTTLASFLISQSSRYRGYRTLAFDRLNGMKVFTHYSGGEHYDFAAGTEIQPFSIAPNSKNSAFITSFLVMLMGVTADADINSIAAGVSDIMDAKEEGHDAHMTDIEDLLGPEGSVLRESLRKWLPEGAYGDYFNGKFDALEFKSNLVTLDMTQLLDRPDVLGPMAHYILHRLKIEVQDNPAPYAVFIDEANKYITSEVFAPIVRELASEIRKTDGVLMLAAQSPKAMLEHQVGREIMTNMATLLVFPDPAADWVDYGPEGLGLNTIEFAWVKRTHRRQVLVKRRGQEGSAILDVDLSTLGDMTAYFDSSSSAVKKLETA